MARIPRVYQPIFAASASNNGVFGSAQDGSKIISNDLPTLMEKPAWAAGWLSAVIGGSKFPPLEEFQSLNYINTTQLAYLFQEGIPEWNIATIYFGITGQSIVKQPGTANLFLSLTDNNVGNALPTAPASNSNWQFLCNLASISGGRSRLSANTSFYVATTGNDSTGTGLTIGSPWLTLQHAVNIIQNNYDLNGFTATINVADGTYTGGVIVSQPMVDGFLQINGDLATPASCIISTTGADCFQITNGAIIGIGGFKVTTTTSGAAINVTNNAIVNINGGMIYDAVGTSGAASHMVAQSGGRILITANYQITAGTGWHWDAVGGQIQINANITITLTGSPVFTNSFAQATTFGQINPGNITTFSGAAGATTVRYFVANSSIINTNGSGGSYLPGTSAGSADGSSGGYYV